MTFVPDRRSDNNVIAIIAVYLLVRLHENDFSINCDVTILLVALNDTRNLLIYFFWKVAMANDRTSRIAIYAVPPDRANFRFSCLQFCWAINDSNRSAFIYMNILFTYINKDANWKFLKKNSKKLTFLWNPTL